MNPRSVFISYKHDKPWAHQAKRLCTKLRAAMPIDEIFLDAKLESGVAWKAEVDAALQRCTDFVALLCDDYWVESDECRRELDVAVARHEKIGSNGKKNGVPRLLFVKAADIRPGHMKLQGTGIQNVGALNFLGPYNDLRQLIVLATAGPKLDAQLGQLRDRLLALPT